MKKPRILVVESARVYQHVVREIAAQTGVECVFADRLSNAFVMASEGSFDLFVVSTHLPDGNGADWARRRCTSPRLATVPTLLVTMDDPLTMSAAAISMGVTEVVGHTDLPALKRHFAECAARWAAAADARVIVLTDSDAARALYCDAFHDAGLSSTHYVNAADAIADVAGSRCDLIVTEMSLANGMTCLNFLREVRRHGPVPMLIAANIDDPALRLQCMRAGADDFFGAPIAMEELVARALTLIAGNRHADRVLIPSAAPSQSLEDSLTTLASRALFDHLGPMTVSAAARHGYAIAVLLFDIDGLAAINATKGRECGDRIIAAVGSAIQSLCRREDIVARFAGDRFAVMLPYCDLSSALLKGERMRARIAALRIDGVRVTASAGIAASAAKATCALATLMSGAEAALRVAKSDGRNRVITEPEASRKTARSVAGQTTAPSPA